jgi:hypothetical protein
MKRLAIVMMASLPLLFAGCVEVEKEKMQGTWVVDSGPTKIPKGTEWEFTQSTLKLLVNGKRVDIATYSVDGNILTFKFFAPNPIKEGKARITALTDERMVIHDDLETKDLILYKRKQQ